MFCVENPSHCHVKSSIFPSSSDCAKRTNQLCLKRLSVCTLFRQLLNCYLTASVYLFIKKKKKYSLSSSNAANHLNCFYTAIFSLFLSNFFCCITWSYCLFFNLSTQTPNSIVFSALHTLTLSRIKMQQGEGERRFGVFNVVYFLNDFPFETLLICFRNVVFELFKCFFFFSFFLPFIFELLHSLLLFILKTFSFF